MAVDDDDIASAYLRRMRGAEKSAEGGATAPADAAEAAPRRRPSAPPPLPPADRAAPASASAGPDSPFDSGPRVTAAPVGTPPAELKAPSVRRVAPRAPLEDSEPAVAQGPAAAEPSPPASPQRATAIPGLSRPAGPAPTEAPPAAFNIPGLSKSEGTTPPAALPSHFANLDDDDDPPAPAPAPRRRPVTSTDDAVLPLGAPVTSEVQTDVQPKINPGSLPIWMASEGLNMLRDSDYKGAAEYYENEAKRDPNRAEGWLGIGAALVGTGDFKKAVGYLLKGMEFDKSFPIGVLLSEAKPGHPRMMFNMAELFMTQQTTLAMSCAMMILDECLATPTTPQSLYMKADELKRKCRDKMADMAISDRSGLVAMQKHARRSRVVGGLIRFLITVVVLGALGFGGWFGYTRVQAYRFVKQGMLDYSEAWQVASTGSGALNSSKNVSDPIELYYKAWSEFKSATDFNPKDFQAWFMTSRAGEAILERARANSAVARKLSPQMLGEVDKSVKLARAMMTKLDPTGSMAKERQTQLNQSLQQK